MVAMSNDEKGNSIPLIYNKVKREVFLTGDITDEMYQNFALALGEFDRTKGKITVILNTGGGNINAALAMYDVIRQAKNKIVCNCFGGCMSAGMVVLGACDERYAAENCRFMVHPPAINGLSGSLPFMNTTVSEMNNANDSYIEILARHSGLTVKEVRNLCKETTYMSAEQVMGYGFIDGILTPNRRK